MASNDSSGSGGSREEEDSFLDWDGRATLFDDEEEDEEGVDEEDEDREIAPSRARKGRTMIDPDDPVAVEAGAALPFEDEDDDALEADDLDEV